VQALHRQGWTQNAIAAQLGLDRRTVRKYLRASDGPPPRVRRRPRPGVLTPYLAWLEQRWAEGCHNARHLLRELQAQGYRGGYTRLTDTLKPWRGRLPDEPRRGTGGAGRRSGPEVPSPAAVRWWLLGHTSRSDPETQAWQEQFVATLCAQCSEIATARGFAERFGQMVRQRQASDLEAWLTQAEHSGIPEFRGVAKSLRQDQDAVDAALSLAWSNGQTEGHVNRLKLIKRQMYGRANFDLLRARVLPMVPVA